MKRTFKCLRCGILLTGKQDAHGVVRADNGPPDLDQEQPDPAVCSDCEDPHA